MQIRELIRRELSQPHEELRSIRREKVERWFDTRADAFIKSAARGLFTKTIDSDHLRAEFKAIARALGGEGKLLEDWFEIRAEAFLKHVKGPRLEIGEVRKEFKIVAREYGEIMHRFEGKSMLRGSDEDSIERELQQLIKNEKLVQS